jgi:hypothetical protein
MNDHNKRRPLTAAEIIAGYSANSTESDVERAHRNAMTLKWLGSLPALLARRVERAYAVCSEMQLDEVTGCLSYITDQPSLDWAWGQYESEIRVKDFLSTRDDTA